MSARYYPLFVDVRGRACLVVGGGSVGERKVRGLLRHEAAVRLVARDLTPHLEELTGSGEIVWLGTEYDSSQLHGVTLVFAATSNPELNRRIASEAAARSLWCNSATDPEAGSFILPAVLERGNLSVAVATDGLSPAAARRLRDELDSRFGREWAVYLTFLGNFRKAVQARDWGTEENQRVFRAAVQLPLLERVRENRREAAVDEVSALCAGRIGREELLKLWDDAWT